MGDDDLDDDDDDEDDEDDDDEDDVDIWLNFRLDEVSHKDMECRRCTFSAVYWVRSFTTERKKCQMCQWFDWVLIIKHDEISVLDTRCAAKD